MARTQAHWEVRNGQYIEPANSLGWDILIKGTDRYLNFGSTSGITGYGIRDNAGVMEAKNSGGSWSAIGGGSGTVTSVASADGSITVTNPTTTVDLAVVKAPKLSTARTISITGDIAYTSPSFDGSANVTAAGTLATVNGNVGTFGSATQSTQITANGKGLITAIANVTITPAVGSITGLGTGVATALGVNIGTAGSFVTNGGALGTPSSGVGTNLTGTGAAFTAGKATILATARTIAGVSFDGSANISIASTGLSDTANIAYLNAANSFTLINPLTTIAESWIGPSSTTGIYFKGGNVGIGTTGPGENLEVQTATSSAARFYSTFNHLNGQVGEVLQSVIDVHEDGAFPATASNRLGFRIRWQSSTESLISAIDSRHNTSWGGGLVFLTKSSDGSATGPLYERMVINNNGNIGIGTTSPTALLHLKAGTATANTSPLKFSTGPLSTAAEAGSVEFLTDAYYGTKTTGSVRGMFALYTTGRVTAQTAANTSILAYTLPAVDASFQVSANVLVTTSTTHSFTMTVAYTDEGNTARVLTLQFSNLAGTFLTAIANAAGAVPYEGVPVVIRCKASTAITFATTGTFTTVTYNAQSFLTQVS